MRDLTPHEREEMKGYKQVWYLGKKAVKRRYNPANVCWNRNYLGACHDNREGFYKVVSTEVFIVEV